MAVPVCNSSNPLFPSSILLLCSLFFMFYYFPLHATALSSNFTNIDQKLQDINITAYEPVYITDQGIQVTPNDIDTDRSDKDSRATCKEPLYVWDNASNSITDFNTYFLFVIGSDENVDYGDGLTFFLVPYDSTLNITKGGAIGLPANQITGEAISPFVLLWSLIQFSE